MKTFTPDKQQAEHLHNLMSAKKKEAQRRSFAYGNAHLHNDRITKADIDRAAEELEKSGKAKPQESDTAVILEVLKEQPPEGYEFYSVNDEEGYVAFVLREQIDDDGNWEFADGIDIPLQYPIGETIGIPESCIEIPNPVTHSWYEDIRKFFTVTGNTVKRVQDVNQEEMIKIGFHYWDTNKVSRGVVFPNNEGKIIGFSQWFNSQYAKPRPRRKNREITHYECWCWDVKSWCDLYSGNKNYTVGSMTISWKKKYLTIHPNPYVNLITVRKM